MPGKKYKCDKLSAEIQKEIISLCNQGYSSTYIEKYLEDRGIKIGRIPLENWLKYKNEGISKTEAEYEKSINYQSKIERDANPNPFVDTIEDIRNIFDDIGKSDDIIDLDNEFEVADIAKKLAAKNLLTLQLIITNRLNKYQSGETKFPTEQIRALMPLLAIFDRFNPPRKNIAEIDAINVLLSAGFVTTKQAEIMQNGVKAIEDEFINYSKEIDK